MGKKGVEMTDKNAPTVAVTGGIRNYVITVNNHSYNVSVAPADGAASPSVTVVPAGDVKPAPSVDSKKASGGDGVTEVDAPTPGNIIKILVEVGASVTVDQPLVVMETMKMESEVKSPCAGKISAIHVAPGDTVHAADPLFTIGK